MAAQPIEDYSTGEVGSRGVSLPSRATFRSDRAK